MNDLIITLCCGIVLGYFLGCWLTMQTARSRLDAVLNWMYTKDKAGFDAFTRALKRRNEEKA